MTHLHIHAPPLILSVVSLGGAVAVHVAEKRTIPSLAGLVVIDVVEGELGFHTDLTVSRLPLVVAFAAVFTLSYCCPSYRMINYIVLSNRSTKCMQLFGVWSRL